MPINSTRPSSPYDESSPMETDYIPPSLDSMPSQMETDYDRCQPTDRQQTMTDFDNNNGISSNVASVAQAFHFFSGLERPEGVSVTFRGLGGKAVDIDSRIDARGMDLVIPSVRSDMRARVSAAHRPRLVLDPPCHTYSVGRYRHGSGRVLRRWVNGVVTIADGLSPHELEQLRVADVLRDITLGLAELACRAGGSFIIENPVHRGGDDDISNPWFQAKWGDHVSWWCHPDVQAFATRMNAQWVTFPQCALGGKFQKLTTFLLSPDLSHLASFLGGLQCRHRHHDSVAREWSEGGEALIFSKRRTSLSSSTLASDF